MTKSITTLVEDIYSQLDGRLLGPEALEYFQESLGEFFTQRFLTKPEANTNGGLRFSNLGRKCDRYHWYLANAKSVGEPAKLSGQIQMMFTYGHMLEALVLTLAKASGHEVTCGQEKVIIEGIEGHCDAVIDGMLVDVKSCNDWTFSKIMSYGLYKSDDFGYLSQLSSYLYALGKEGKVSNTKEAGFLCINKTTGEIGFVVYNLSKQVKDKEREVKHKKAVVASGKLPARGYSDRESGSSGNREIVGTCKICSFRDTCWPKLRVFKYMNKGKPNPKYLSVVRKPPLVEEIT